jgi:predicted nucleotidyltransferase
MKITSYEHWLAADGTIAQENVPMNKEDVLTKLRELKPAITARYKVREIGLFGSFVRGEQGASSDIDLLAEFEANADLFDLIGLELYLEEIFQRPVDIVPKQALRVELRETVLHQVVTV